MSFDPVEDTPNVSDGSADASKPGLQNAWRQWTSDPANNAALLQFGIAMLQPRAPGQSAIGAAANAVAEGGGAAGRVTAAQKVESDSARADAAQDTKDRRENSASEAALINANAYSRIADAQVGGASGVGLKGVLAQQRQFNSWLMKPEDMTGMAADPIVGVIQKQFPDVKTKADLLNNPQARAAAFNLFKTVNPETMTADDSGAGAAPATAAPVVPQSAQPAAATPPGVPTPGTPRTIYGPNGKPYTWDGIKGHAPVPQ